MEEKDLLQNSCGGFPYPVTTQGELESFSCGDKDLDDFFHQDAFLYAEQLLGKTYYFSTTGDDKKIVCAFTLANDSIKAALTQYLKKSNTEEDSEFKENKELSSSIDWKTWCGKGVPRNSFICWFTSD